MANLSIITPRSLCNNFPPSSIPSRRRSCHAQRQNVPVDKLFLVVLLLVPVIKGVLTLPPVHSFSYFYSLHSPQSFRQSISNTFPNGKWSNIKTKHRMRVVLHEKPQPDYLEVEEDDDEEDSTTSPSLRQGWMNLSRREIVLLGVGGTAYGKLVGDVLSRIQRGDAYPPEHEDRVSATFRNAILAASSPSPSIHHTTTTGSSSNRPFRIMEIGIGSNCRTITRGLYDQGIEHLFVSRKSSSSLDQSSTLPLSSTAPNIEFVGMDVIEPPSSDILDKVERELNKKNDDVDVDVKFEYLKHDVTLGATYFPDGHFDVVTCSLLLCSVTDQSKVLAEIIRLLNPNGGAFGYVEHVAVDLDNEEERESRSFLELQQRLLDPLQQAVAHNCHLHRNTDVAILDAFSSRFDDAETDKNFEVLHSERFFVDGMWPVSCQCCGVIALNG